MEETKKTGILSSFPRVFWIANVMELFERGAYYGMNAVLAVYLTKELKFSEQSVGFLQSIVYALTYILPILSGALADRYGFRRFLLLAFSLLSTGYFLAGYSSTYATVFVSLLIMATGSGLFKPIITGVIARTTNQENSAIGFGIYYWMINMGAFLAPLLVSYLKGFSWMYVFLASSIYCALMLIPTIFLFKDPPSENKKNLKDVLSGMVMVLGDARFMLMIFVYSGFWILYFQTFGSVLWFLRDFIDAKPVNEFMQSLGWSSFKFDSEFVTMINAGVIILLQAFISRLIKDNKPLPTMVTGLFFGVLGFVFLAFASNVWIFIIGIVVFTLGEMTAHPKYYSYIGIVAPADKKTVYMGYGFLYGIIGSLVGSNLGGTLYEMYLKPLTKLADKSNIAPQLRDFWMIFVILGVFAMLGLIIYNRFFSEDTPKTNRLAWKVMTFFYASIIICGGYVLYRTLTAPEIAYKTLFQVAIMFVIGLGGVLISLKNKK